MKIKKGFSINDVNMQNEFLQYNYNLVNWSALPVVIQQNSATIKFSQR
ncbi:hypothetical protein P344_00005 [Spiroplasma mirum ATCC 29335]|uniref:Uncharacterized protein n=1 Tax=Spiroplasma mirum ATCC 29335 TaxID=838561 RepID=W6AK41_9MOLU|nr:MULTISPECIES: hypothetical protein [Spiroplasma]AHI57381.1 hypothetical protein P344_00005 [Spiroplasma mirum ATCC 29335]AKM53608.1 hypothetical protein SATRI_v1c12760 [Spiroplasma atrichopogonis]